MNPLDFARRLLGRQACKIAPDARLGKRARVINIFGESQRIQIGSHSVIEGDLLVFAHGGRISIGEWCFIGEGTRIWSGSSIVIGHRVLIAHNVNIFDNLTHPIDSHLRHEHFRCIVENGHPRDISLDDQPVHVEDDVWIGAGSSILRGITIGRGAIIAAGSIVTHDVPELSLVAGNPARVVRMLEGADKSVRSRPSGL